MSLNKNQVKDIKSLLKEKIRNKLKDYSRESTSMPFLVSLIQDKEKVASYSFIHSVATMLGMSIYEQVAKIVAREKFDVSETSYDVEGFISDEQNKVISKILQEIKNGSRKANKVKEIKEILSAKGKEKIKLKVRADLYLKKGDKEFFIEIKTAKPNIDVFNKSKEKLLQWIALKNKAVRTFLAIPYNPYYPEPYRRFTLQGVLDEENELVIASEFWDTLGGDGTYKELLKIFDEVGKELKNDISKKIKEVAEEKMVL